MTALLSKQTVAKALGVSLETLQRVIARGELPVYRVGGRVRICPDELKDYLQRIHVTKGSSNA